MSTTSVKQAPIEPFVLDGLASPARPTHQGVRARERTVTDALFEKATADEAAPPAIEEGA